MKLKNFKISDKTALPAGDYWLGDPCYVFPKEHWNTFCDIGLDTPVMLEENGEAFYVFGTAYGGGCYTVLREGEPIGECGVDAGLLSVIPASLIKRWQSKKKWDGLEKWRDNLCGVFITTKSELTPGGGSNLDFGQFAIETN